MPETHHPYSKPDQQGKFDGLCGVYAILNSIKYLYHISEDDLDAMFQILCQSIPEKFPQALWNGLGVPEITRLLKCSITSLAELHGYDDLHWRLPFLRKKFVLVNSFWRSVGEQISANVPTVVHGITGRWHRGSRNARWSFLTATACVVTPSPASPSTK
jgi:hypothetical protein